jgi:hypothetical protein
MSTYLQGYVKPNRYCMPCCHTTETCAAVAGPHVYQQPLQILLCSPEASYDRSIRQQLQVIHAWQYCTAACLCACNRACSNTCRQPPQAEQLQDCFCCWAWTMLCLLAIALRAQQLYLLLKLQYLLPG